MNQTEPRSLNAFWVLGVRVDAVRMRDAVAQIERWIGTKPAARYVAVTGMHGIAEARRSFAFQEALQRADLVVPDGMPLVWIARSRGLALRRRVCGADLMTAVCRRTDPKYRHFFYGGAPGVAQSLAQSLHEKFGITVAGTYTPPFRALTSSEEASIAVSVRSAAPDILWVGLGTPRQELWMYEHASKLNVPVMVGVGAAFDMLSGRACRAPRWMQVSGLEWLHRLCHEPRRLSRRYLLQIPPALCAVLCHELFLRRRSQT